MTLKRTTDRLPRVRYGSHVEFAQGERETDDYDPEREQWAIETYDELVRVGGEDEVDGVGSEVEDEPEDEDDYEPPERDGSSEERSIEDEAARVVNDIEDGHPR